MIDKHNFAGYIKHLETQYFCTVSDFVVKMLYIIEPGISGLEKVVEEDKYLFGVSENNCCFAVLMPKESRYVASSCVAYRFCTPILVKAKSPKIDDLAYFDGIEFYGDTVNKIW